MFYSHEVLTSRKYGVATVWLVATLGSKSTLRKVSRKQILDVDVAKACEAITTPEAPMALRLQSNLLYGVARVYSQQCGYVLTDAESARNNIRLSLRALRQAGLEPEGSNKAKADQLMLHDDPNFLPGLDLIPLDLDNLTFSGLANDDSQSILSPHNSQLDAPQQYVGDLMLPPSQSSFAGGPTGGLDLLSARRDSGREARFEPPRLLEDDIGITIDPEGNISMDFDPPQQDRATSHGSFRADPGPERVSYSGEPLVASEEADGYMPIYDDPHVHDSDLITDQINADQQEHLQGTTSETATALHHRKPRLRKTLPLDAETTLSSTDLKTWGENYGVRMREELLRKQSMKLVALARKNAEHWVLEAGTLLGQGMRGPLDMFTGAKLLEAFAGVKLLPTGQKRPRDEVVSPGSGRRVRARAGPSSDEIARGVQDEDDIMPLNYDDTIEQGREAPTPLDERHMSSILPWNQSAGSRRPTDVHPTSGSAGAGGPLLNILPRRGSRLTSASPLLGRGPLVGEIDDFQLAGSDVAMAGLTGEEEFELFGPAAQVDTQTAQQTQWQRRVLGAESANFLDFVRNEIDAADQRRDEAALGDDEDEILSGSISFQDLLAPDSNSRIVAAQALLHVLALGTKNMLKVAQREPFTPINLRVNSG